MGTDFFPGNDSGGAVAAGSKTPPAAPPVNAMPVPLVGDLAALDPVYEDHLRRNLEHIRIALLIATPGWAAEVLGLCNTRNRKLTSTWARLRAAIVRGAWRLNGECIVFDRNGVLVDGQHRLTAIAQSGRAVPVLVIYGVDPEAFVTMDQGKKRSGADVLSTAEDYRDHAHTIAAALTWLARKEHRQLHLTSRPSPVPNEEILERVRRYPGLIDSVRRAQTEFRTRLIPPGMVAFLDYVLTEINPEAGQQFLSRVCAGIDVPRESWEARLRKRLDDFHGNRTSVAQRDMLALIIKAFNGSYLGLRVPGTLVWRSGGEHPESFPSFPQG